MKRILLIIIVCICNVICLANNNIVHVHTRHGFYKIDTTLVKEYNPYIDKHLASAITSINRGDFGSAKDTLLLVNNWQFCPSDSISIYPNIEGNSHGFLRPDTIMNKHPYYFWTWDNCRIEIIHPQRMHQFVAYKEQVPVPSCIWRKLLKYYREQIKCLHSNTNDTYFNHPFYIYYYQELRWIYIELDEEGDVEYAKLLYDAGTNNYETHDYFIASKFLEEAYGIGSSVSKSSDYSIFSALCLGDIYYELGNYEKAEYYLNCALNNPHHTITSLVYYLLGNLFLTLGDSRQAETHFKQSLQLAKRQKEIELCMQSLYGLIYVYYFYDKDIENATSAAKQLGKYSSNKKRRMVNDYSLKGTIFERNNVTTQYAYSILIDLNDSTEDIEQNLKYSHNLDVVSIESIINLNLLSLCSFKKKHYLQAIRYSEKARAQAEQAMRDREMGSHQEYAKTLSLLIQVYSAMGLPELANPILLESAKEHKDRYLESLSFLTARQRDLYWDKIRPDFINLYPAFEYRNYPQWPELAEIAYDNELFTKGLLLTSSDAVRRSVLSSGDTVLIVQWEELTALRQAIKAMQERMTDIERIDEYEQRAEELEKIITVNSAAYRENMQQWSITWDSVRKALKPQQVAIEYMSAPINEDSTMYCALLLRDTCSQPILIPLFEQKEVDTLLYTSTKDSVEIRKTYTYINHGKALSDRIWNNVKPYLNAGDTVYFSATGVLHQIAIENLWCDSTHTMADMYTMVRLSSTRELAIERESIQNETATLYGGIYYSAEAQTMVDVHKKQKFNADTQDKFLAYNQTRGGLAHANPLTATQYEISATEAILKDKHFHVEVLSGHMANEESFKHLSGQKQNILHIATHGFYTPDSTFQNPLERCGLLFAGANILIDGNIQQLRNIDKNVEDGLVTAKDISLMDLRGADIVVLSACETGLGDVTGEGVFGLQRAFKMAGAQTLIMSLWQVHDLSTQILMTAFYKHWIEKGESKHQAFRAAQQEVRNSGFESPYYWAGFILLD